MNNKKLITKILALIFTVLTLAGAFYVLMQKGQASPGYAAVPMIFALAFITLSRQLKE